MSFHELYCFQKKGVYGMTGSLNHFRNDMTAGHEDNLVAGDVLEQLYLARGVDLRGYRSSTVQRRLSRRLAATGCTTCREYLNLLKSRPEEYDRLINSLTNIERNTW
jgi:two-component system CheB/CheR fusion protein